MSLCQQGAVVPLKRHRSGGGASAAAPAAAPNPAQGSTTVNVTLPAGSTFAEDLYLRLVSSEGKEVLVQQVVKGENHLPLRGLAGGIHYLHLTSGNTWLSGTKLIVE